MGSFSDSDAEDDLPINAVHDTEPFHDPCDDDNENRYLENTVPFDDDIDGDDALLSEEEETEPFNLAGETQPLDDFDDGDGDTQLFDDEGGAGGTEVLENVDSDDPHCVDTAQSQDTTEKRKLLGDSDVVLHQHTNSGSMPPRYTFLRAESLRQAALATRKMALKQTQVETNSVIDMSQSCREPQAVKDNGEPVPTCSEKVCGVGQENHRGKDSVEVEGSMDKNMCKVATTAARKLFIDDLTVETNEPSLSSNDLNEEDILDKLPIYHDELAGLSYINSQEPGELSQINALYFVDKFLKDNVMDSDQEISLVKNVDEKSKSLPPSKGQQSLAKRVSDRGKSGETGIYDWDDSCEDEGGGDIFLRRKEDFFDGGTHKSLPGFQKIKVCRPNDEKQSSFPKKGKIAVRSDSRLGMLNLKVRDDTVQEATRKLKRNLANELDEQFKTNCSRGEVEPNPKADVQEMLDVGMDTQIAAEAMEALCNANDIVDNVANDVARFTRSRKDDQLNSTTTVKAGPVTSKEYSRQYDRKRKVNDKSDLQTSGLSKKSTKKVRQCKKDNVLTRSMRSKLNAEGNGTCSANENDRIVSSPINEQRKSAGTLKRHQLDELNNLDSNNRGSGGRTVNKKHLNSEVCHSTPIARRTRQSLAVNQLIKSDIPSKSLLGDIENGSREKRSGIGIQSSKALDTKSSPGSSDHFEVDDTKLCELETLAPKASAVSVNNDVEMGTLDCPKRRRSIRIRKLSSHDKGFEKLGGPSKPSAQPEDIGQSTASKRKTRMGSRSVVKSQVNCRTQSSLYGGSEKSSIDQRQGTMLEPNLDKVTTGDARICCNVTVEKDANLNSDAVLSTANFEVMNSDESQIERYNSPDLASATPANCKTPVNDASPVCMGDGYYKRSCNRNLSSSCLLKVFRKELHRDLRSLSAIKPELTTPSKDSRKRRDMTDVRILYSHHLDEDIVKHQKKVLARLGVSVASSIADATHFIADQFVRTRNMLEAIAYGKPVVTHLWIESCGQASCFIDERNYILRDAKKEKEIGFSMPVSLARASQHPLLEGCRVLITPNTKPSKEIISSLVKAVWGQAVERIGRSALKDLKFPDDLLILSCEEDYSSCVPFLEKGATVYSSELLLNGIVTQKLEYERHRLFADQVKKTRSTIWLKRDENTFIPVTKCN